MYQGSVIREKAQRRRRQEVTEEKIMPWMRRNLGSTIGEGNLRLFSTATNKQ
jgi:hypothetical protein